MALYNDHNAPLVFGTFRMTTTGGDFLVPVEDRRRHVFLIGKSGSGKSTLMENLILQDIYAGRGVTLIDPHGDLAQKIADAIPRERINDTIYFSPADREFPIGFNPLAHTSADERELVASGIVASFKGLWGESWGEWLEYLLKNAIMAMLEYPAPGLSLAALPRMLLEPAFRKDVLRHCKDREVARFWNNFFNELSQRAELDRVSSTLNKAGKLTLSPTLRNILSQVKPGFDFKRVLDQRQILIVNLSKGLMGADNSNLLGSLIVSHIVRVANQRAAIAEHQRVDHGMYVDEFSNFTSHEFSDILSESRKYRLSIAIATQFTNQMKKPVLDAILGNVGTMCVFSIGPTDAELFEREFTPVNADDLMTSACGTYWVRYSQNAGYCRPQEIQGLPPIDEFQRNSLKRVIENTRTRFATPRKTVEQAIEHWIE